MQNPATTHPVLIIGATGMIGSRAAQALRSLQPKLPLVLAGRDLQPAADLAKQIGNARAITVDLTRADLGIPEDIHFSGLAIFLKDDSLNSLKYAQAKGIAYMDISTAAFEIGPEVARYIQQPTSAPVLMNSNWLAGTSTLCTLHFAKEFKAVDTITISAFLDEEDIGGKAADIDYNRQTQAVTSALVLEEGKWKWLNAEAIQTTFESIDGRQIPAQAFSNLDVLSLASATDAKTVSFAFAVGETSARRQGDHFSHEIIITITGDRSDGTSGTFRYEIVHPEGQAPMTSLSAAIAIERLIGLNGDGPVRAGLYLPHVLIDPEYAVAKLKAHGMIVRL